MSVTKHIPDGGFETWAAFLAEAPFPLQNSLHPDMWDSPEPPSSLKNLSPPMDTGAAGERRSHCCL